MAKFDINFVRTCTYDCYYTIEAEDEDDARRKAEELVGDMGFQADIDDHVVEWGDEYEIGEIYNADNEPKAVVGEWFNA